MIGHTAGGFNIGRALADLTKQTDFDQSKVENLEVNILGGVHDKVFEKGGIEWTDYYNTEDFAYARRRGFLHTFPSKHPEILKDESDPKYKMIMDKSGEQTDGTNTGQYTHNFLMDYTDDFRKSLL